MNVQRYRRTRFWAVYDPDGTLVCVTVYRKGAEEVARRMSENTAPDAPGREISGIGR